MSAPHKSSSWNLSDIQEDTEVLRFWINWGRSKSRRPVAIHPANVMLAYLHTLTFSICIHVSLKKRKFYIIILMTRAIETIIHTCMGARLEFACSVNLPELLDIPPSSGGSWWNWPGGLRNFISGWTYGIVVLLVFIISGVSSHSSSPYQIRNFQLSLLIHRKHSLQFNETKPKP